MPTVYRDEWMTITEPETYSDPTIWVTTNTWWTWNYDTVNHTWVNEEIPKKCMWEDV